MIGAGRAGEITEAAGRLAERTPFREGRWVLLARALYVAGRQADALAAQSESRAHLGLDRHPVGGRGAPPDQALEARRCLPEPTHPPPWK
jgi:hypothetical protein